MWTQSHQNRIVYEREKVKVSTWSAQCEGPCDAHWATASNQADDPDCRTQEAWAHEAELQKGTAESR